MEQQKVELLVRCEVTDNPTSMYKTLAAIGEPQAQVDLMFMKSILVSTGENLNDDVFVSDEMWAARNTPVLKPVDWEHETGRERTDDELKNNPKMVIDGNQTIGVMYNTYAIDENGQVIDEEAPNFVIPNRFDIIDEAVIWKGLYPKTASKIENGAKNNTLFVSMEAWFKSYDYLVGNKIVARNEETAFLDNSLRAYGGNGSFGSSRVKRVLRGITFGGKGMVARPANEPSIIQSVTHEPMCTSASKNQTIIKNVICDIEHTMATKFKEESHQMSDNKNVEQAATSVVPLEQFTKVTEEAFALRAEAKTRDAEVEVLKVTVGEKDKQIESVTSAFTKGCRELDSVFAGFSSRVSKANPENFFSLLAEELNKDKEQKEKLQADLQTALNKVLKIEEDAKVAARKTRVDALEIDEKAKKSILASVTSLGDEAFDSLLTTLAEFPPKKDEEMDDEEEKKKDKKKDKKAKSEIEEVEELANALLESVTASEQVPAGEEAPEGVDLKQAYSGLIANMLNAQLEDK